MLDHIFFTSRHYARHQGTRGSFLVEKRPVGPIQHVVETPCHFRFVVSGRHVLISMQGGDVRPLLIVPRWDWHRGVSWGYELQVLHHIYTFTTTLNQPVLQPTLNPLTSTPKPFTLNLFHSHHLYSYSILYFTYHIKFIFIKILLTDFEDPDLLM